MCHMEVRPKTQYGVLERVLRCSQETGELSNVCLLQALVEMCLCTLLLA